MVVSTGIINAIHSLNDVSRTFSLFPRQHELGRVLQILKHLGQAVQK